MLYISDNGRIEMRHWRAEEPIPEQAVWIDMNHPSREQELAVEAFIGMEIPTREEMRAIEVSDRLYQENGAYFLTATLITKWDSDAPEAHAVTFIVTEKRLVTLRYSDPLPFRIFASQIGKLPASDHNGPALLLGLIDSVTNRLADILERIGQEMDCTTREIFTPASLQMEREQPVDHQKLLNRVGLAGDAISKTRESLMTLGRLIAYATQCGQITVGENREKLLAQSRDIAGLNDQASYLGTKVTFLLDAVLGLISTEQNNIIKIFSVAAVMFLPPTLIASIYGMNFEFMPELHWKHSYPVVLFLMVCSAAVPYFYFKRKKWL